MKKKVTHPTTDSKYMIGNTVVKDNNIFLANKVLKKAVVCQPFTLLEAIERKTELNIKLSVSDRNDNIKIYKLVEVTKTEIAEFKKQYIKDTVRGLKKIAEKISKPIIGRKRKIVK